MLSDLSSYFTAEKRESVLFILVGILAIGVAAWLWSGGHRLRTMAIPLVAVALIQLGVGGAVWLRTDAQLTQLQARLQQAPQQLKAEEGARMRTVMKNFGRYKAIEIGLLVLGVLLVAVAPHVDVAAGVGAGLLLQSSFMLCLDLFAEARGSDYLRALAQIGA